MDEKAVKNVVTLAYIGAAVMVLVMLIDLQIKNAIIAEAAVTTHNVNRLRDMMGVIDHARLEETSSARAVPHRVYNARYRRRDDPGMEMGSMDREATADGTAELPIDPGADGTAGPGYSGIPATD